MNASLKHKSFALVHVLKVFFLKQSFANNFLYHFFKNIYEVREA